MCVCLGWDLFLLFRDQKRYFQFWTTSATGSTVTHSMRFVASLDTIDAFSLALLR